MRFVIECWRHAVQFENQIDIRQTNLLLANELFIFGHLQAQLFVLEQFA